MKKDVGRKEWMSCGQGAYFTILISLSLSFHFILREMLEPLVTLVLRVLLDCRECPVSVVPVVFQD